MEEVSESSNQVEFQFATETETRDQGTYFAPENLGSFPVGGGGVLSCYQHHGAGRRSAVRGFPLSVVAAQRGGALLCLPRRHGAGRRIGVAGKTEGGRRGRPCGSGSGSRRAATAD